MNCRLQFMALEGYFRQRSGWRFPWTLRSGPFFLHLSPPSRTDAAQLPTLFRPPSRRYASPSLRVATSQRLLGSVQPTTARRCNETLRCEIHTLQKKRSSRILEQVDHYLDCQDLDQHHHYAIQRRLLHHPHLARCPHTIQCQVHQGQTSA